MIGRSPRVTLFTGLPRYAAWRRHPWSSDSIASDTTPGIALESFSLKTAQITKGDMPIRRRCSGGRLATWK